MSAMPGAEATAFSGSASPGPATSGSPASTSAASVSAADADTAMDPLSRPVGAAYLVGRSGLREVLLSPGMTVGCRIVMGVTMAFMLLIMI
jgi:hypothetical protein